MMKDVYMVVFFLLMIVLIVGADVLVLRDRFWPRLIVNVAIVGVFAAIYFVFLKGL